MTRERTAETYRPQARSIVALGLLTFAILAAWSLTMPLMSSPDEPSHAIKAAAVVRGEWSGRLGDAPSDGSAPGAPTWVSVPADIAALTHLPDCYQFEEKEAADCAPGVPGRDGGTVEAPTYAGQYPPLYYALVGWPSLVLQGAGGVYAMRLVSAGISAFFLVWAARRVIEIAPRRGGWGVAVAVTPMCLFIGATVNPNGLEITSALSFWAACLALARGGGDTELPRRVWYVHAAVAGAVLVNVRTSGPIWAALCVAVALVVARPGRLRLLLRRRAAIGLVLTAVAAGVTAVAWLHQHSEVVTTSSLFPEYSQPRLVAAVMLIAQSAFLAQMVGNFGWLDTPAPFPTLVAWAASASVLLLVALVSRHSRRLHAGVALLAISIVVVPIALTIPTAEAAGIIWQGRYTLPLAVGLPLLVAIVLPSRVNELGAVLDRLAVVSYVLLALGHVFAFYWAVRRYAEGADGQWVTLHPEWNPPLGFAPAVVLYAVLFGLLCAWALRRQLLVQATTPTDLAEVSHQPAGTTTDRQPKDV